MVPPTAQKKGPNLSTPRTPYTNFLRQFIGDFLRMLYLHEHTHTLVEFASAMDEVFKEVHKEFNIKCEVSYDQWVSRKDQWDKDFDIKNGGPPKEIRDGLFQYPTLLECHEGKIRPRARQPGHWLVSDLNSNSITGNQLPPLKEQPSEIYLKEQGPVHHQIEYPWTSGGSLSNAHGTSIIHQSTYNEPLTQVQVETSLPLPPPGSAGDTTTASNRYFGPHENLSITESYLSPAGTNEWNVVDHTMPYGLPTSTYPTLPVQPPRSLQDLRGGRNTSIQPDPSSRSVSAAKGQDQSYPQTRPSA